MKKPLVIEPEVLERIVELPLARRAECWQTIGRLVEAYGHPHLHTGIGIRKLLPRLLECRVGLELRLLFRDRGQNVSVCFLGNHDEVRKEIRSGKYD